MQAGKCLDGFRSSERLGWVVARSLLGTFMPLLSILLNYALVPNMKMTSGIAVDPATGRLTEVPAGQEAAVARLLESGSDVED